MPSSPAPAWEIERKFLVRALPGSLGDVPHEAIDQGYLAYEADGAEARVRRKGARYFLTVKRGRGLKRREAEVALSREQFETLWPLTEGRRLAKTRYEMSHEGYTVEVDVYAGTLSGLVVAEVEFASEATSVRFTPPDWLGDEVTGDARYGNLHLALYGRPNDE